MPNLRNVLKFILAWFLLVAAILLASIFTYSVGLAVHLILGTTGLFWTAVGVLVGVIVLCIWGIVGAR